jgi:acetyl esterase
VAARYLAPTDRPDGLILYVHGGGWVLGALADYETYARTLASETGYGVLLLDYRLAPEHPFPAGLQDCEDALAACLAGSIEGILVTRPLIIAGDSAGANLITVAARRSSQSGAIAAQVLSYPVTDCDFTTNSYKAYGEGLPLTAHDMKWFFEHYAPDNLWKSPDISPLRTDDLSSMPPTVLVTAEYDVLCDEGEAYAQKLRAAGVPVTHRRLEGMPHGFVRLHNLLDVSRDEMRTLAGDIRAAGGRAQSRR